MTPHTNGNQRSCQCHETRMTVPINAVNGNITTNDARPAAFDAILEFIRVNSIRLGQWTETTLPALSWIIRTAKNATVTVRVGNTPTGVIASSTAATTR